MFKFVNFKFFLLQTVLLALKKKIADQLDFYMLFKCMFVLAEIDMIRATLIKTAIIQQFACTVAGYYTLFLYLEH